MIQTLKFKKEDDLYWTSDIHCGHEKEFLLEPRGYSSAKEANENLIRLWNDQVDVDATVFHLGDIVVGAGSNGQEVLESLLNRLNYKEIYLMAGNHPSGWKQLITSKLEEIDWLPMDHCGRVSLNFNGRFVHFIPNYFECRVGGRLIVMSHYPLAVWNEVGKGSYMICGHSHNSYPKSKVTSNHGKILDVGIESALEYHGRNKTLFSFDDIENIMKRKNIEVLDHH